MAFDEGRRRFVRWDVEREARVRLSGADQEYPCQIKDLSLKGVQVSSDMAMAVDTSLNLTLILDQDIAIDVEAWVNWERHLGQHHCYGLYFTRIKDKDKEKIYQYLCRYFSERVHARRWETPLKKEETPVDDKRVFTRFPICISIKFLVAEGGLEGMARSSDISSKGIGFVTDTALSANTAVELWLKFPQRNDALYTRGEVKWSKQIDHNEYRVGVELARAELASFAQEFGA